MSKITFKSALVVSTILLFPFSSYAFHTVNEVLPDGNLMVCKHFNQVIKDNKVEVYKLDQTKNRGVRQGIQIDEFQLPQVGAKVELFHKEFHDNGKKLSKYHNLKVGSGIVVDYNLAGKEISAIESSDNNRSSIAIKNVKISDVESKKLHSNCIVIQPEEKLLPEVITSVHAI